MVTAGPGSGKTFVLTHRILYLIRILGISPNQILVLTFSKKAAGEMKERFEHLFENPDKKVLFATFHSLFLRILKQYENSEIHVLSKTEMRRMMKEVLRNLSYPLKTNEFCDELLREISLFKARGGSLDSYAPKVVSKEDFSEIYNGYESLKSRNSGLDYEDLLIRCRDLLISNAVRSENDNEPGNGSVLEILQKRYRFILVDEFQDINAIQYEFLYLISGKEGNLFAVGDDDQSIYGFRGSDPEFMRLFLEDFPKCRRYSLNVNYRSRQDIVKTAGNLIAKNKNRLIKEITCPDDSTEKAVFFEQFSGSVREYDRIVRLICELCTKEESLNDSLKHSGNEKIAILFRTNDYPEYLLNRLSSEGIDVSFKKEGSSVFDRFVGKDLLSYFRIIQGTAKEEDYLRIYGNSSDIIKPVPDKKDKEILASLDSYAAILYLRKEMGYDRYLKKMIARYPDREAEIKNDMENLTGISRFFPSLREFYSYPENLEISGKSREIRTSEIQSASEETNCTVLIMTFHASKGLEFDTVILPDLCEGVIPSPHAKKDEEVEEERRLLYVGMTRAKQRLYLFSVENKTERIAPSRFIKDIH